MPNFENVFLGAPCTALVVFCGKRRELLFDDYFEVCIPSLSKSDTRLAATMRLDLLWEAKDIEFREIEGRLFRPFLAGDESTWGDKQPWTVERLNEQPPPTIRLDPEWRATKALRTTLLGSPFRPWKYDITEAERQRGRRSAPRASEEARARLAAVAAKGLRFVDRVLFQETRTPGWTVAAVGGQARPAMPDMIDRPGITLIDPRRAPDEVQERLRALGYEMSGGSMEMHAPSLLPDTIEADALASLCVRMFKRLSRGKLDDYDPRKLAEALDLLRAAETAIRDGTPLDDCYHHVERLASPGSGEPADVEGNWDDVTDAARQFLELKRLLPPLPHRIPVDDAEADGIADAFKP